MQYGIVWHFDSARTVGTFANGDYWVVGPVRIRRVTPDFDGRNHGWEVNPRVGGPQGFAAALGSFDASLVPSLPYTAKAGESLVKTIRSSAQPRGSVCRECLLTAAVLTVVDRIPAGSGTAVFRPPYVGTNKVLYKVEDVRLDLLPSLVHVPNAPTLAWVERAFGRVQLDHKGGRLGRNLHPRANMPDYGADIARRNADGCLRLMLADSPGAKRDALIAYLQYGIDLYQMVVDGQRWPGGGGHRPGQKLPLSFAAVMLDNRDMQEMVRRSEFFAEDRLVYRGANARTALFGSTNGYERSHLEAKYWRSVFSFVRNRKPRGYKSYRDPYGYIDGGYEPGGGYQLCCLSQPWKGSALACELMPALKKVWNDPAFFEYVERWTNRGAWTQPDPCAPVDSSWALYGVTFGPDGDGGCIPDTDSTDGVGRFPGRHEVNPDGGARASAFQTTLWRCCRRQSATTNARDNSGD